MSSPVANNNPDEILENLSIDQANALLHKLTIIHNSIFSQNSGAGFFQFGMLCEKLSNVVRNPKEIKKEEKKEV